MKKLATVFLFLGLTLQAYYANAYASEKVMRDSVMKFGVAIEPYLKSVTNQKIDPNFNYSPYINQFLQKHKYVKFPPYPITVGIDESFKNYKSHILVKSGNRLYFPKGSALVTPKNQKTNGYMMFIAWDVKDVFIDGVTLIGSKANPGYETSPYGAGIAMYAPTKVTIANATVLKNTGDGITVRTQWGKQSEDIVINKANIQDATRVGMLITGIINGTFKQINIEGTGEKDKSKVVKPQTALSFEPNDCTSKYVNCKFSNLKTRNNLGPVVATTNFYNIFVKNTCGPNKIDVTITNWEDFNDDPACYGASFDISSGDMDAYDTKDISGTFRIINPKITRNGKDDYYFFHGEGEKRKGGVHYILSNTKLVKHGVSYTSKNRLKNQKVSSIFERANKSNKMVIK